MGGYWRGTGAAQDPAQCADLVENRRSRLAPAGAATYGWRVDSDPIPPNSASPTARAGRWAWRLVLKSSIAFAVVAISLVVEESYPFSHNPMYSKFSRDSHYYYVTDERDEPIIFRDQFGTSAIKIKKLIKKDMDRRGRDDLKFPADLALLEEMGRDAMATFIKARQEADFLDHPPFTGRKPYRFVRLYRVNMSMGKDSVVREEKFLVAEIEMPPLADQPAPLP